MKIINSINRAYLEQLELNEHLRNKIDNIITNNKPKTWHYFSRIKTEESYALKLETGRFDPKQLEDFFACTIVVENTTQIKSAIQLIEKYFVLVNRKPENDEFTSKLPESFRYDDLRLYVKLKSQEDLPPEDDTNKLSNILFEIQIITFLQHAWSIATHDLVYKGEEINWGKSRVAYQVKAMLEHAEISIHEIEKIKESEILSKKSDRTEELNKIKTFLTTNWPEEALTVDLVKLSSNISALLKQLKVSVLELQSLLNTESDLGRGVKTLNLSPYFIILQTIINQDPGKLDVFFSSRESHGKIVISDEIDLKSVTLNPEKIVKI